MAGRMEGVKSGLEDSIVVDQAACLFRHDEGEELEPSACPAMGRYLGGELSSRWKQLRPLYPHIAPGAHEIKPCQKLINIKTRPLPIHKRTNEPVALRMDYTIIEYPPTLLRSSRAVKYARGT